MLLEIKIAILILAGLIAAYTDYKTGYIYDWLNYSFIALGAILAFFSPNVIWAFIQAGIIFALGYIFYRTGKIGGGDIKFFAGLSLFFPFFNGAPFILIVLVLSSLFAILFYGIYYLILLLKKSNKQIIYSVIISFLLSLIVFILFLIFSNIYFATFIFVFLFFSLFTLLLKDLIMQRFYTKEISIAKLLNDDLIDLDLLKEQNKKLKSKIKAQGNMFPLDKETFNIIKEELPKTTKTIVYRNLPVFGPFIALGIIFSFIFLTLFNLSYFI